jgi:hypothetical protein
VYAKAGFVVKIPAIKDRASSPISFFITLLLGRTVITSTAGSMEQKIRPSN